MLHVLQQLPLNYNEFHVLSATPRNTECNMKQPPNEAEIAEQIGNVLRPLRHSKTRAQAQARAEMAIEMLRKEASRPFPDAAFIKKAAENLRKAIEPLGDAGQTPTWLEGREGCGLEGCEGYDGRPMTLQEFRSALDWFEHLDGPSSKVDRPKHLAAVHADSLVNEFSEEPPTATVDGRTSEVASLLYEALTGEADVKLKHQVDAVRRSWRCLNLKPEARGR
jgi:hypothetical protein